MNLSSDSVMLGIVRSCKTKGRVDGCADFYVNKVLGKGRTEQDIYIYANFSPLTISQAREILNPFTKLRHFTYDYDSIFI